jgi:hypothetical protein
MISAKKNEGLKMHAGQRRCMSFMSSSVLATTLMMCQVMSHAQTASTDCKRPKVNFDGRTPLVYESVDRGKIGVDLYETHPAICPPEQKHCRSLSRLRPGDEVAVGAVCGKWSYVQYLGDKRVLHGWMDSTSLAKPVLAVSSHGSHEAESGVRPVFNLNRGRGLPVCEAYLQQINQDKYKTYPECGMPQGSQIPGMFSPNRVWMSKGEIESIDGNIINFISQGTPESLHGKTRMPPGDYESMSYRFDKKIDVENNGRADNVLMWNHDNRNFPICGNYSAGSPEPVKFGAIGIILSDDGNSIDIKKTKTVFGNRRGGIYIDGGHDRYFVSRFAPIGYSYNIFEYRSLIYYSTFLSGNYDFDRNADRSRRIGDVFGVFLHKNGTTELVCEYTYSMDE